MERQVIGARADRVDRHQLDREPRGDFLGNVRIVRDNAHAEGARALGDLLADAAQSGDAERFAAQLRADEPLFLPASVLHRAIGGRDRAGEAQHQRAGVLGHADAVRPRCVDDEDAAAAGGGDVDVVDTGAGARDDSQPGRRVHQPRVHLGRAPDEQGVGAGEIGGERVGRSPRSRVYRPAVFRSKELERRRRQIVGDNDFHQGSFQLSALSFQR